MLSRDTYTHHCSNRVSSLVRSMIQTKQIVRCGHVNLPTLFATDGGTDQTDAMNLIVLRLTKVHVQTMNIRALISIRQ